MQGIGVHCFAGGFTIGMKKALPVVGQLEIHNFGTKTCEAHGTKFMNSSRWEEWDDYRSDWKDCSFCYGNPRCNSFSSYSAGGSKDVRGPFAKCTSDIWDLCKFGVDKKLEVIAFESVQQCYSVGKDLLRILIDTLFAPNSYRIAHLFVNTAAEGNAQKRRRYFFVAYKNNRNFNVIVPTLPKQSLTVEDAIGPLANEITNEGRVCGPHSEYDINTSNAIPKSDKDMIPCLKEGEDYHRFARKRLDELKRVSRFHYDKWLLRTSELPFSLHCPTRVRRNHASPTICSTSHHLVHYKQDRFLTVGEIATLMGWPKGFIPIGNDPIAQIGKGVVPATGKWLGEQIKLYLENHWGDFDEEFKYESGKRRFIERRFSKNEKPLEKVFHLTQYVQPFEWEKL